VQCMAVPGGDPRRILRDRTLGPRHQAGPVQPITKEAVVCVCSNRRNVCVSEGLRALAESSRHHKLVGDLRNARNQLDHHPRSCRFGSSKRQLATCSLFLFFSLAIDISSYARAEMLFRIRPKVAQRS
jgi:hypothetical protein